MQSSRPVCSSKLWRVAEVSEIRILYFNDERLNDFVDNGSYLLNTALNYITNLQKLWRLHEGSNSRRSSCQDDVSRKQSHKLCDPSQNVTDIEHKLWCIRVLQKFKLVLKEIVLISNLLYHSINFAG